MKIDSIKTNLRNIFLLAREYREKISVSIDNEIKELTDVMKNHRDINEYDRQFYEAVMDDKKIFFEQIIYFAERILIELAKRKPTGELLWGYNNELFFDAEKFKLVSKELTKDEVMLLEAAKELILNPKNVELQLEKILQKAPKISGSEQNKEVAV